jgi:hypothetical protein
MYRKIQFFAVKKCISFLSKHERKLGFHGTIKKILQWAHAKKHIKGLSPQLKDELQSGPTVILANHPTSASVLALIAALPKREDIYLFVGSKFFGHNADIDKHLIPAYINNRCQPAHAPYADTLPKEEEHRRNIASISQAAEKVNNGGLVLIFPGYPEKKDGTWYCGAGHMIKQISNKNAKIELVHIAESPNLGYLRVIPLLGAILPSITFHFAPSLSINDYNNADPKHIIRILEKKFKDLFV